MFKVMIADDNPYILQDFSELIDWEDFAFELAGTYTNGKDLLAAASKSFPDLVITDISMPQMDGFQLSRNLYQINPKAKIVFISEYSEFDYARNALNLHILNYLVKPILKKQLVDVMNGVLRQLRQEQQTQAEQQELASRQSFLQKKALSHYVYRLFFHPDNDAQVKEAFGSIGVPLPEQFHLYVACYTLAPQSDNHNQEIAWPYLKLLIQHAMAPSEVVFASQGDWVGSFLVIAREAIVSIHEQLSALCVDVEMQLKNYITIGYSLSSDHFTDLPMLYSQARSILDYFKDTGSSIPVMAYQDIPTELGYLAAEKKDIPDVSYSEKVAIMRSFIEEHYMDPIITNDVAEHVYLSATYANSCFNKECGITIFGYLTQCRMAKAKTLLSDTNEQITRISELVGYREKTSFYLAFKRHTGISPTEYRLLRQK